MKQLLFHIAFKLHSLAGALTTRVYREEGQTLAEYGMLIAVIAIVVVAVAVVLGSSISALFRSAASKV
jgi:Flp pilus assembly pilin Flp